MPDIAIDKLQIEIEASSSAATKSVRSLASALRRLKKDVSDSASISSLANSLKEINNSIWNVANLNEMATAIKDIGKQQARIGNVADYLLGISKMDFSNLTSASNVIGELAEIANAVKKTKSVSDSEEPSDDGTAQATAGFARVRSEIGALVKEISGGSFKNFFRDIRNTSEEASNLAYALDSIRVAVMSIVRTPFRIAWSGLQKIGSALGGAAKSAAKLGLSLPFTPFVSLKNAAQNAVKSVNRFTSSLGRILLYRTIRSILKEITQGIKEGIDNLSAYSRLIGTDFHKSLDGIASDALYIKNSFATVAAPIINFVKPAFDALADSIANAMNLLAEFMARLTGASSYTRATKFATEYGDAIQKAGNQAKEARKQLLGIDELNIFNDKSGGGGSGFDASDYKSMFEEVALEPEIGSFAEKVREAIQADDWKSVGTLFGEKINSVFSSFSWAETGAKIGKGINNVITAIYSALKTVDFRGIGKYIATALSNSIKEINFTTLGSLFTRRFTALLDFVIGFVETLDWRLVGKSVGDFLRGSLDEFADWSASVNWDEFAYNLWKHVKDFIAGIDFSSLANSFFTFLGTAFGAAVRAIGGFFRGVWEDVREYFRQKTEEAGGDTWEGFKKGVKDAWSNVTTWIKENIVDPFVNGFKALLGIHSPSTVFAEIGGQIVAGLLQGLKDAWSSVTSWLSDALSSLKQSASNVFSNIKTSAANAWSSIKSDGTRPNTVTTTRAYASGGFPEDGLFFANHNELVGQFSNGRTAVANNEQITDGIADAVYRAFTEAFSTTGGGSSDNQPIEIYLDGQVIAKSTTKYQRQYARAMGV